MRAAGGASVRTLNRLTFVRATLLSGAASVGVVEPAAGGGVGVGGGGGADGVVEGEGRAAGVDRVGDRAGDAGVAAAVAAEVRRVGAGRLLLRLDVRDHLFRL